MLSPNPSVVAATAVRFLVDAFIRFRVDSVGATPPSAVVRVRVDAAVAPPGQHCQVDDPSVKMRLSSLQNGAWSSSIREAPKMWIALPLWCLGDHVKAAFGVSWKEELCKGQVVEGEICVGSPALLVISSTALRSLESF